MKQDTKKVIIETGARIIHQKGYNHTGIQEVLKSAGVPKGSFYFHFKSKDDFGLQVIDYFDTLHLSMVNPILNDETVSSLKRIEKILDHFIILFKEFNYTCGCPIGNLSQEMGDLSPVFRKKLEDSLIMITTVYKDLLDKAKEAGEIVKSRNTQETAEFIVSSWHGSIIKMKIQQSVEPLILHKKVILRLSEN